MGWDEDEDKDMLPQRSRLGWAEGLKKKSHPRG
jgi:hypothetical protein